MEIRRRGNAAVEAPWVWWKVEVPMDLEVDDFDPYVPWSIHFHTDLYGSIGIYTPIGFSL